jgi:hypothetical protein
MVLIVPILFFLLCLLFGVLLQLIPGAQRVESHCEVQPSPPGFFFK